jgi:hypothetical protein
LRDLERQFDVQRQRNGCTKGINWSPEIRAPRETSSIAAKVRGFAS